MFGTGIFITTGEILFKGHDALLVLILWGVGGVVAITGSLCYAELATMWPHVGGEYIYLKKVFGYLPSFLTGWISLVVGFSASVATSSITFVSYINKFWYSIAGSNLLISPWSQKLTGAILILLLGAVHIHGVKVGSRMQAMLTGIKLLIVLLLLILGLAAIDWATTSRLVAHYTPVQAGSPTPGIPTIGLMLLIIMFSYSGFNGAAYIAGEIKNPSKTLPKALLLGTSLTIIIYIGLNIVFLMSSPGTELMGPGRVAVAAIATKNLFGPDTSNFFTLGIALILLSSISVQMMIGPRVYYAMAKDNMTFGFLKRINPKFETPSFAILAQIFLSILYVYLGSAETLMEYMGFALGIFPILTIIGLMVMRKRHPEIPRPYKVPFYPVLPIIYIILSSAMMIAGFMAWTKTSLVAIAVLLLGVIVFYGWGFILKKKNKDVSSE